MSDATKPANPYVGPHAFQKGERIYGRDREIRELLDLLIAERIVLLHSPSGAGKSSLVQAGLLPLLEEENFEVLPIVRVNLEPPAHFANSPKFNRYVFSVILSLEETLPEADQKPVDQLAAFSLAEYLEQRTNEDDTSGGLVLIFDQFEEVLTTQSADQTGKFEFFQQVGDALRDRSRWALFSIREDYVAALSPYVRPLPTRLANRYRLDLLGTHAAHQAVQEPAKTAGSKFQDKAAHKLIDDLRRVLVQRPDGSLEEQLGPFIEPVQLQVVCYRLWSQLTSYAEQITLEHLASIGNVDDSLADYYAEKVYEIAGRSKVGERAVRQWIEQQLITEGGFRGQVLMGKEQSAGLDNNAIRLLVNAHLVRGEKRRGATWFELSHDRLINPVRQNNINWSLTHLSLLQRQATLWEQQNRSDTLLLRTDALEEAEAWTATHPNDLDETDREFLKACIEQRTREQAAQEAAERERRLKLEAAEKLAAAERRRAEEQSKAASRLRRRAYILAFVLLIALAMAGLAYVNQTIATANATQAVIQRSTAQAASTQASDNALRAEANAATAQAAGELAIQNADKAKANEQIALENAAIAQAASTEAVAQQITAEYNAEVARTQANLARSRELASLALSFLNQDTTLTLLLSKEAIDTADTGQALDALLHGLQRNLTRKAESYDQFIRRQEIDLYAVAASPDGQKIAWGGTDGLIRMWDLNLQEAIWQQFISDGTITTMTFSPDGSFLVTGDTQGNLGFWDTVDGKPVRTIPSNLRSINTLGFSPDGVTLAYGGVRIGDDANLFVRNLETGFVRGFRIRQGEIADVLALAWSPDGTLLASGGAERIVHIWEAASGLELQSLKDRIEENELKRIFEGPIRSLVFSPDGKWLATGAEDNEGIKNRTILVWDTATWADGNPLVFQAPAEYRNPLIIDFSPDGQTLVSAYDRGEVVIWNFNSQSRLETLNVHSRPVEDMDFIQFQEALLLVSVSLDRNVILSNLIELTSLNTQIASEIGLSPRLIVNPQDTLEVTANTDDGLVRWQIKPDSGEETQSSLGVNALTDKFITDQTGNLLAFVEADGNIVVEDLQAGQSFTIGIPQVEITLEDGEEKELQPGTVDSLAFNTDGSLLAAGFCSRRQRTVNQDTGDVG